MVSALISEAQQRFGFRIVDVEPTLDEMQKLVGGYIEAVTDSNGEWHLYCDEEGGLGYKPANRFSTELLDQIHTPPHGFAKFSDHGHLAGTVVWLGPVVTIGDDQDSEEHSVPIHIIAKYSNIVMAATDSSRPLVVVSHDNHVWVYDNALAGPTARITDCVEQARYRVADGRPHGTVEVYANVSTSQWTELRVEIMDDFRITLHDEREDRSYG